MPVYKFNAPLAVFSLQSIMSILGLAFAVTMIVKTEKDEVYVPVLTSIVGFWLPSPLASVTSKITTSPAMYVFLMQSIICSLVLLFCGTMLLLGSPTSIFLPIITGVMAYWLPSPAMRENLTNPTTQSANILSETEFSLLQNV